MPTNSVSKKYGILKNFIAKFICTVFHFYQKSVALGFYFVKFYTFNYSPAERHKTGCTIINRKTQNRFSIKIAAARNNFSLNRPVFYPAVSYISGADY